MAITDILNGSWNGNKRKAVREKLQEKLQEMVAGIASLEEGAVREVNLTIGNNATGQPVLSTRTVLNKQENGKYKEIYRELPLSEFTEWLGLNDIKAILVDMSEKLAGKAGNDAKTGHLPYSLLPHQVLSTMGEALDGTEGVVPATGTYYVNENNNNIYYKTATGSEYVGLPDRGIIYANAVTKKLYLWTGSWTPVAVEVNIADIESADFSGQIGQYVTQHIVNGLNSESPTSMLSAAQGRLLDGKITDLGKRLHAVIDELAADSNLVTQPTASNPDVWAIVNTSTPYIRHLHFTPVQGGDIGSIGGEDLTLSEDVVYYVVGEQSWYLYRDGALSAIDCGLGSDSIVDDLVTGGRDKALSAEQGKKLDEQRRVVVDGITDDPDGVVARRGGWWIIYSEGSENNRLQYIQAANMVPAIGGQSTEPMTMPLREDVVYYSTMDGELYLYLDGELSALSGKFLPHWVDTALDSSSGRAISNSAVTTALAGKIDACDDGRVASNDSSMVLLKGINVAYDGNIAVLDGIPTHCTDGKLRRVFMRQVSGDGEIPTLVSTVIEEVPSRGVLYWDSTTGRAYQWRGGVMEEFSVYGTGGGSQAPAEIQTVDTSTLGGGSYAKAVEKADLDPSALWQWVLKTTDGQGNEVRKIIWHVGGGEFIDAQGTPIIQTQS